jgi:hypothetical protein
MLVIVEMVSPGAGGDGRDGLSWIGLKTIIQLG